MTNTALILIDIQNDYFKGGAMELHAPDAAANRAAKLLEAFREANLTRIHIQHTTPAEIKLPFLRKGTDGAEIHPTVKPTENETIISKTLPNSFFGTSLHQHLQELGITQLVICGMMTHMCVSATARASLELGYQTIVAADATATRELQLAGESVPANEVQRANLAALDGFIASIETTDTILEKMATSLG